MASRKLTIKTNVVIRLIKEVESYKQEVIVLTDKVQKMSDAGEDEYEVRQQGRVLDDSKRMVPDSERRLDKAVHELRELVASSSTELADTPELALAQSTLADFDKAAP
ncbi:tubulin binding cofactor A [Meredithblackwellia eburnea MCA 4105]